MNALLLQCSTNCWHLCNLRNDKGQTHFTILHVEYSGRNSYQVQDGVEYLSKYRVINL